MDVYMEALKTFSKKEIYDLDDQDVLDFLIFKDVNNSGRTVVHHRACPNVGLTPVSYTHLTLPTNREV